VFIERSRRVWAATKARAIGHGGIAQVERATGISRATIQRGLRELDAEQPLRPARPICEIDRGRYPGGVNVTDAQMAAVNLQRHRFRGEWNYTIWPASKRRH
jgi:hypothetical protein